MTDSAGHAARGEHTAFEAERARLDTSLEGACDRGQERIWTHRLLEHQDRCGAAARAEPRRGGRAVEPRELRIQEDGVEGRVGGIRGLHDRQRVGAALGEAHVRPGSPEHEGEERAHLGSVVGEQDAGGPHGGLLGTPVANL